MLKPEVIKPASQSQCLWKHHGLWYSVGQEEALQGEKKKKRVGSKGIWKTQVKIRLEKIALMK